MGLFDAITHPIDTLKSIGGGIVNATGSGAAAQPVGVGGPAANPSMLQQDPTTGLWFDPSTGTTYTDNTGQMPVKDPNVAQQVASNFATQQSFLDRLRTSDARSQQAFQGQMGLAGDLNNTIHNVNAPSVAQQQLNQGLEQIQHQQGSAAAGVGGQGGVLARLLAANNIANAGGQTNQAAALTRANEVQGAQQNLAGLLQGIAGNAQQGASLDTSGALGFGGLSSNGAQTQQTQQLAQANQSQQNRQNFFNTLMKIIGGTGSAAMAGGGAPGAGAGGVGTTAGLGGLTAAI